MHPSTLLEVLTEDRRRDLLASAAATRKRPRDRAGRRPLRSIVVARFRLRTASPSPTPGRHTPQGFTDIPRWGMVSKSPIAGAAGHEDASRT